LLCIPGASGTAEIFYRQMISLCPKGYRIISIQPAPYETHEGFCKGLERFLDKLGVVGVHIFGTALGGYLAQSFAQYRPARVLSLILNNTFSDTQYFYDNAPCASMFSLMPEFMLKRILLANFPVNNLEADIANSVDFMVEQLESLSQAELASRLTLNCTLGFLRPNEVTLDQLNITIMDTMDDIALPEKLREEVYKFYPNARQAQLKDGGNFAYLSRADEVNMHIQVHLRKHGIPPVVVAVSASVVGEPKGKRVEGEIEEQNVFTVASTSQPFRERRKSETKELADSSPPKPAPEEEPQQNGKEKYNDGL